MHSIPVALYEVRAEGAAALTGSATAKVAKRVFTPEITRQVCLDDMNSQILSSFHFTLSRIRPCFHRLLYCHNLQMFAPPLRDAREFYDVSIES